MRRFVFRGPDGSSDVGSFTIVTLASTLGVASAQVAVHLADLGRSDLRNKLEVVEEDATVKGIVYSNLEARQT